MLQFGLAVFFSLLGFYVVVAYATWIIMEGHKRRGK